MQKKYIKQRQFIVSNLNKLIARKSISIAVAVFSLLITGCALPRTLPPSIVVDGGPSESLLSEAPPTLPTFLFQPPQQAELDIVFSSLVVLEREASHQQNLFLLSELWAPDSLIIDGRGTITLSDDYQWKGKRAILDRYLVAVFPYPPPQFSTPPKLDWNIDPSTSQVVKSNRYFVAQNGHDHWVFVYQEDRWWLQELVYSSPAK